MLKFVKVLKNVVLQVHCNQNIANTNCWVHWLIDTFNTISGIEECHGVVNYKQCIKIHENLLFHAFHPHGIKELFIATWRRIWGHCSSENVKEYNWERCVGLYSVPIWKPLKRSQTWGTSLTLIENETCILGLKT